VRFSSAWQSRSIAPRVVLLTPIGRYTPRWNATKGFTLSGPAAQIQGVWLDPALRGRGLSEPAVAGVTEYVLADYPIACLYVNDFNTRAIRCYERVGYEQVGEFATILF